MNRPRDTTPEPISTTIRVSHNTATRIREAADALQHLDQVERELTGCRLPLPAWTADEVVAWLLAEGFRQIRLAQERAARDVAKKHATGLAPKRRPRYTR